MDLVTRREACPEDRPQGPLPSALAGGCDARRRSSMNLEVTYDPDSRRPEAPYLQAEPQNDDGLQLPSEWQFEHGIEYITDPQVTPIKHVGSISTHLVMMGDRSLYRVHDGRPYHQAIPTADVETTPYSIQDDRGIIRHRQEENIAAGFRSVVISRERQWHGDLSQARTAHNMLRIAREVVQRDRGVTDPTNMQFGGISRSGMQAIAAKALSSMDPSYGVNVFYFDSIAPCFPRMFQLKLAHLGQPANESLSLLYHMARLPLGVRIRYSRSIDPDPRHGLASALALTNGDSGRFVDYIPTSPQSTHGHILAYAGDTWGMGEIWRSDFENHSGVQVELERGRLFGLFDGHLRAVSGDDFQDDLARQRRLREESQRTGSNIDNMDFSYVNGIAA